MRKSVYFYVSSLVAIAVSPVCAAQDFSGSLWPAPQAELNVGDVWSIRTRGRYELDAVHIDNDQADHTGGIFDRRARLGAEIGYGEFWTFTFEMDVAREEGEYTDVALEYDNQQDLRVQSGHFKEYFGMERTKSSLHTLFIERAALDTFTPKRNLGAQITHYGNQGSLSYGIFTDSFQSNTNKDTIAFTSRATYAWHLPQGTLHGGMAGTWRKMEKVGFSALPDTSGTNIASVQTGTIRDIDRMMQGGVELAYGWRNVLLEGEYITSHLQRDQNMDAALYGWYAQAAWMLSGEPYRYSTKKDAVFQSVTPNKPFSLSQDTWGAFEWGVRYQTLSLSDAAIQGGQMYAVTTGLNWYPNTAWKLAANVTYNHSDAESVTPYDNPVVAALRLRVAF